MNSNPQPLETYEEWLKRTIDLGSSALEKDKADARWVQHRLVQQEHLECHIEVTLEQLLLRLGLSPKARVIITPETVDWAAVGRAGELELDLTDRIEVHWEDHREVAR